MSRNIKFWIISVLVIYAICAIEKADAACNWPSPFGSSSWLDSTHDDVTFSDTRVQGWTVSVSSTSSVNEFECLISSTFSTDGRIIVQSTNTVRLFSVHYYVYVCLTFTQITDVSYRYYVNNRKQENALNQRLFIYPNANLTATGTICDYTDGATGAEYHVMIQSSSDSSAKVNCPWAFLGHYGYSHTTASNVVTCDTQTSQLDTCTATSEMQFDYTVCTTKVAYSESDTVWCVDNVDVSGTNYVMLYNGNDANTAIDNINVFRFTCMAIAGDGTQASVSPRHCQTGQTADQFPSSDGTEIGARVTFASPTVTCPTCPALSDPDRGSVSIATSGAVTAGVYTCDSGYTMHGVSTRTCQSSGSWSLTEPYCSCATPSSPSNGDVLINSIGTLVNYICDVGFTLNGVSSRSCQLSSATWNATDPSCTQCEAIGSSSGRSHSLSTDNTATTALFSCLSGYILTGVNSAVCSSAGQWSSQLPTCTFCDVLTDPSGGSVSLAKDGSTTTSTYSCSSGYSLVGTTTRTCLPGGSWSGSAPSCICNTPSSPSNGAVVADGTTATYTCSVNYTLNGDSPRTCQTDGSGWDGSNPTCTECATLSAVTGGTATLSTTGTTTSARFTCLARYTLDGTSPITCQANGLWNNAIPQCVQCPMLTNPNSGAVTISTSGTTSTAAYACASGYEPNGNTIRLCLASGTWSLSAPTCSCQSPDAVASGSVAADGQTANYTCNSGYTLNGVSTRTCADDGSGWSGSAATCTTCATLITPTGGSVTSSTDGLNTQAMFTCNKGYTINGVSTITCRSDGTWNYNQPTCAECPDLNDPSSGSVATSTSDSVTTATFSCSSGYYISGAITLTCGSDGTWDNNSPSCKCNFPITPSNGGVSVSDSSSGTVAAYTCNTGYSLSGLSSRTCQTDGSGWEGTDPSCSLCDTVTSPTNGSFTRSSNSTFTKVMFICDVGSTLSGSNALVCLSNGSYDNAVPTCELCPSLNNPQSGSVTVETDGFTTTATFTCVTGYYLTSGGTLTCMTSGEWNATSPSCICNTPPTVANGNWNLATNQSTVTYTCDTGYVLTGSQIRHCQTNGDGWSGTAPACDSSSVNIGAATESGDGALSLPLGVVIVMAILLAILLVVVVVVTYLYITLRKRNKRVSSAEPGKRPLEPQQQCNTLQTPSGGNIEFSTDGSATNANYSCSVGYNLEGAGWLTCQVDRTWDLSPPTCVTCATLEDPFGGQVTLATDGYVSTAAYSCPSGYYLVGTDARTCSSVGTWDLSDPTCACSDPATPANGVLTANGTAASYTCNLSYSLIGPQSRACLSDGSGWSDTDPVCTECSNLDAPTGGSYQISTTGIVTSAAYTCDVGYTLSGNALISCQSDGSWETSPTCVECVALPAVDSGNFTQATDGYMTVASYSCASGYNLNGASARTCSLDGSWTLSAPTCSCQSPATPPNGHTTDDGETATYGCDVDYSLNGVTTRTCSNDGSGWSGSDPSCKKCQSLTEPDGGNFSMTSDGIQTEASFTCNLGYTLSGAKSITCSSDGTWNAGEPVCSECPTLSDPASGSVSMVTDGYATTATFSCVSGYYISGTQSVTCGTDGQWSASSPSCKCNIPMTPANGAVSVSDGAQGPEAAYSCMVGYSLDGSSTRLCQANGQGWDSTDPTCVTCNTLTTPTGGTIQFISDGLQTHALVTCSVGYTLEGAKNMTCRNDASWDVTEPTCVNCQTLLDPSSGSVTLTTNDYVTTASFSCVTGYYVSGALTVTCGTDGQWSDNSPICKCNIPAVPSNGAVSVSDGTHGPEAYYLCDQGYSLAGSATRLCQSNGQGWDSTDPVCTLCPSISVQQGTEYSTSTNGTTTTVAYTCPVNYTLDGVSVHTCDGTGAWDHSTPTCVHCAEVHSPFSGSVSFSTDGRSTIATFSCFFGYSLNSTAVITCQANGAWNLPDPACVCDPPASVSNGAISLSADGRIANYSCDQGYQLVGSETRFCFDDGTGWNGTAPRCDAISMPTAGPSTEDEPKLSLHLAVFIVMVIIILALVIALAFFIYFRSKIDRSKISATFESNNSSQPIEEGTSDLNSPNDVESGKAALIGRHSDKTLVFNVRKQLKPNGLAQSSEKPLQNGKSGGEAKPLDVKDTISKENGETTVISMPNGSPQNIPIQSVRLPKLPPRPPAKEHTDHKPKSSTKRTRKPKTPKQAQTQAEPRTSTPLEVQMSRAKTPEVLSAVDFGYITPQYCYEVDTPLPPSPIISRPGTTRPLTAFSGNSTRTAGSISVDIGKSMSTDLNMSRSSDIDKSRSSDIDKPKSSDINKSRSSDIDKSRSSDIDKSRSSDIDKSRSRDKSRSSKKKPRLGNNTSIDNAKSCEF